MSENAVKNTDREIWRERPDDAYSDSIHVTVGGAIGLNCGGYVFVKPIREWHALAKGQTMSDKLRELIAQRELRATGTDDISRYPKEARSHDFWVVLHWAYSQVKDILASEQALSAGEGKPPSDIVDITRKVVGCDGNPCICEERWGHRAPLTAPSAPELVGDAKFVHYGMARGGGKSWVKDLYDSAQAAPPADGFEAKVQELQDAVYHYEEVTFGGTKRCDFGIDSTLAKEVLRRVAAEARLAEAEIWKQIKGDLRHDSLFHEWIAERLAALRKGATKP